MARVVEAVVEREGQVRLLEPVKLSAPRRAFVLILDEDKRALRARDRPAERSGLGCGLGTS